MASTGVVILDKPVKVNWLKWFDEHIGCNMTTEDEPDDDSVTMVAYSTNEKYNRELSDLAKKNPKWFLFSGISSQEVNAID